MVHNNWPQACKKSSVYGVEYILMLKSARTVLNALQIETDFFFPPIRRFIVCRGMYYNTHTRTHVKKNVYLTTVTVEQQTIILYIIT